MSFSQSEGDSCQRGGPKLPIKFRVGLAAVERQAVAVEVIFVKGNFLLRHFRREEVEAQNFVPNQIVFLAPGAGLVKGQAEMVAVTRHLHPALGELLRLDPIFNRGVLLSLHVENLRVRAQAENGFDGEVRVVRQVTGKVVGAELVFRIKSILHQVIRPQFQNGRVLFRERRSALCLGDRGEED